MRITTFKALYPDLNFITESESFFEGVKQAYLELKESNFFRSKQDESLYICEIKCEDRTYTGLIAAVDIRDYIEGKIKKHELTLSAKEQVHVNMVLKNKAFLKPVLLTYPYVKDIHDILLKYVNNHQPFLKLEKDVHGQEHIFWQIKEVDVIEKLKSLFIEEVPITYIADGHHRTSTTSLLYNRLAGKQEQDDFSRLLVGFFPSNELRIDEFNRVVEALNEISTTTFMAKISSVCNIEPLEYGRKPLEKNEITMFINKEWYSLKWRPKVLQKYASEAVIIDATLLNIEIIENIVGIKNIRNDQRVTYIEGPSGIETIKNMVVRSEHCVGFCLYPIQLDELMKISDVGEALPPKSTWFQPRLRNGLIIMDH